MERRRLGETFKDRVSDDPNTLVKPKIWGTEALEVRGQPNPLWKILREAMLKSLSRLILILSLNFEPIQKSGPAR